MTTLTKAEWEQVKQALATFWTPVTLDCDGYTVRLRLQAVSQFKNAITVSVDGWFRGAWMNNESEEGRRFFPVKRVNLWSPQKKKALIKKLGKRFAQKYLNLDACTEMKYPYWTSFRSMKCHLEKHNDVIKLITPETPA